VADWGGAAAAGGIADDWATAAAPPSIAHDNNSTHTRRTIRASMNMKYHLALAKLLQQHNTSNAGVSSQNLS
jgi:hypothetical protein